MPAAVIRKATIEDSSLILGFIKELARYEKAEEEVVATVEEIEKIYSAIALQQKHLFVPLTIRRSALQYTF